MRVFTSSVSILLLVASTKFLAAQTPEEPNHELFRLLNTDLNLVKPVSYLSPINSFKNLENDHIQPKLEPEEGANGFLVDVQLFVKIPLLEKRYFGGNSEKDKWIRPFLAYSRIYIDYGFSTRIARDVNSKPALPSTNRYGLRYDKVLFFRYEDRTTTCKKKSLNMLRFKVDSTDYVEDLDIKYDFWYGSLYLHHYSNGQGEGVLKDPTNERSRNNYESGDHSTSFWRFSLGYQWHDGSKQHLAMELGFQKELGDTTSFFQFPYEQEDRYGRNRIVGSFQYIHGLNCFIEYIKVRTDFEYIIGSMSKFPYDNKYRFGIHAFLDAPIKVLPGLGVMVHYYYGRDYLNVRYDNPILAFQLGFSLAINRYSLRVSEVPVPSLRE